MSVRELALGEHLELRELVHLWRERASELDEYARRLRLDGDPLGAEEYEAAALDYRVDAERLELEAS